MNKKNTQQERAARQARLANYFTQKQTKEANNEKWSKQDTQIAKTTQSAINAKLNAQNSNTSIVNESLYKLPTKDYNCGHGVDNNIARASSTSLKPHLQKLIREGARLKALKFVSN